MTDSGEEEQSSDCAVSQQILDQAQIKDLYKAATYSVIQGLQVSQVEKNRLMKQELDLIDMETQNGMLGQRRVGISNT